jgi:cob(I)alamin adenosyltransferase
VKIDGRAATVIFRKLHARRFPELEFFYYPRESLRIINFLIYAMAIYTRKGDKGKTFLLSGQKVAKFDPRIEVYGTIDELSSMIGVTLSATKNLELRTKKELIEIQKDLFNICSNLLNSNISCLEKRVKKFEYLIDQMTLQLPKLKNFILPGGGKIGAALHLSRAICRRLERQISALNSKKRIDKNILVYFNRLSDLLFTMARFVNFKEKKKEIIWSKNG